MRGKNFSDLLPPLAQPEYYRRRRGEIGEGIFQEEIIPFGVQNRFSEGEFPGVHENAGLGENGERGRECRLARKPSYFNELYLSAEVSAQA